MRIKLKTFALTTLLAFALGVAIGFLGAYHGSNYWYSELRKENQELEKKISGLEQEKLEALERSIRIYQKDLEDIWPEEK